MTVFLLLLIIILCLLLRFYYNHVYIFNKNLRSFPCPPEVPILGHALDFFSGKGFFGIVLDYSKTYGDTVHIKIGPQRHLLLTSNYKLFEFILTEKKIVSKSMEYKYFSRWLGTGLLTAGTAKWKKHRQIINPTFHYKILEEFVDVFESNGKILVKQFEKYLDNTSFDICKLVNLCTLDIICETAMGTSIRAQEDENSEYVRSIKTMLDIIMGRFFSLHKMFEITYFFTRDFKKEKEALEVIHSLAWDVIKRRQNTLRSSKTTTNQEKTKKAFLDLLLEINVNNQKLTLEEIRQEVDTFMFAGQETIATAINFILFCLAKYPEEQAEVLAEQKKIFGNDLERTVTFQDLKNMKYLESVIKESLRLYPPGPFFSRELDRDLPYEGIILPKGLTISLFIYNLHRNPVYFPEPEKFCPSRFNIIDGKTPFAFLPFSTGPRNCIGQKFAMAEMKSVVSRVVRNFELLPAIPSHELKIDAKTILISTNGVRLRIKKRKH